MCPREFSENTPDSRDPNVFVYKDLGRDNQSGRPEDPNYYKADNEKMQADGSLPKMELVDGAESDRKVFGSEDWKGGINSKGVDQGQHGDCYFMASMASLADTDQGKQSIHDMIKCNDDGSYTVTFPGDKNAPVRVTEDDIKDANVSNQSKWANVAEAAFLKYTNVTGGPQIQNMDVIGRVQNSRQALDLLTGNDSVQTDQFSRTDLSDWQPSLGATSKDNVANDLTEAFANGRPVVSTASAKQLSAVFGENNSGPATDAHVYSVTGWDPKTNTVTLRNPWGQPSPDLKPDGSDQEKTVDGITGKPDGTMSMSLDTFYSHFNSMSIAGKDDNLEHVKNTAVQGTFDAVGIAQGLANRDAGQVVDSTGDLLQHGQEAANETAYTATHWGWEKAKEEVNDFNQTATQVLTNPVETVKDGFSVFGISL